MIRTDKRLRLCTVLLVCNLLFIWGNSLLPAEVSSMISGTLRQMLSFMLPSGGGALGGGDGVLRKIAHFVEFACLGMLLMWLAGMLRKPGAPALLGGFGAACVDELIQVFVPGRGPGIWDVLLDTAGVLTGICLLLAVHTLLKKRKK